MADSETQQVTSQTPATKQKNSKRVAAGKAIAPKTKQAREAQEKALIEAQSIIANNQVKVDPPPVSDPPAVPDPPAEPESTKMTTKQWLSVISIIVSSAGVYYKREEIKSVFSKKNSVETLLVSPPSPVLPRAPHLLMPRQREKWESERWIKHFILFYNNG